MNEVKFVAIIYTSALVLVGLIQVFIQTFSKKGYTLGVSVPKDVRETETMKQILKDYKFMSLTMTIFLSHCQYFLTYITQSVGFLTLFFFLSLGLISLPLIIYNKNLKTMTAGLSYDKKKIVPLDNNKAKKDLRKIMWLGYGISLLIIIITSLILYINYDKIVNQLIMKVDFDGTITRTAEKSYKNLSYPSIVSLGMIIMFYLINLIVIKVRPRISTEDPELSLKNDLKAKKAWTYYLILNAIVTTLLFEIGINYLAIKNISLPLYILTGFSLILSIGGAIYLGSKVGTDGSKFSKMDDFSFEEDDKYWLLGSMFYNNPDDPALFVAKRVGVGFTINIGRPAGKLILIFTILILVFSLVQIFTYE
ncbi:DUF5808 domain-containing protein [uncultured Anaerococcus sp.]|uniref:DUF5808 domain-containing protein n=1 Tax=uncultured Anaerococcus sp. TaxID=293428 RepID=UPI00260120A8|nr:DUF5808 domain-containing protein [uncultured Anaerococcus sp.]